MGGVLDWIREDIDMITTDLDGFGVEITFVAPTNEIAEVVGLHTKHHMSYDTEGRPVNTRTAHISVAESQLKALLYPVRNARGEVFMKDHKVSVKDSTGTLCNYKITDCLPDETVGMITCQLTVIE